MVLWLFFPWPSPSSPCVELSVVCAFWWPPGVLLFDMRVQSWVGEVAFAASTRVGPADIVVFGSPLAPLLVVLPLFLGSKFSLG